MKDSGEFDRMIRIERDAPASHDGYQNVPGAPFVLAERWAHYLPGAGRERFADAENAATAPAIFTIFWSPEVEDVSPVDRVRFPAKNDGRLYDIQRVEEVGRQDKIRIFAVARAEPVAGAS